MTEKRHWQGWHRLHFDGGDVWHYRVNRTLIDIRAPDGKSYKPLIEVFEAYTTGDYGVILPHEVKNFITMVILFPQSVSFSFGDYVVPRDGRKMCGKVTYVHKKFPRFVRVSWQRRSFGGGWNDSVKLKHGYPSALHALADCAE